MHRTVRRRSSRGDHAKIHRVVVVVVVIIMIATIIIVVIAIRLSSPPCIRIQLCHCGSRFGIGWTNGGMWSDVKSLLRIGDTRRVCITVAVAIAVTVIVTAVTTFGEMHRYGLLFGPGRRR